MVFLGGFKGPGAKYISRGCCINILCLLSKFFPFTCGECGLVLKAQKKSYSEMLCSFF